MANKKKAPVPDREKSLAEYYDLHARAVEDLVTADSANSPPVDPEELRKYKARRWVRLSERAKALLVKAWFAGMTCYFFFWGLGGSGLRGLDRIAVLGVALGLVTELLTNNVLRFMAKAPGANDRWILFSRKGYFTFPLNIVYGLALVLCVAATYGAVNAALAAVTGAGEGEALLGAGPVLFGVFATAWDLIFLGCKRLFGRILADAKRSAR